MGTIVVALLGLQPFLGWLQHRHYLRHQRRGIFGHVHIWYGRALMILGIINGGLGLKLAGGPRSFVIAYSVVAGIVGLLYLVLTLVGPRMKGRPGDKQLLSPPTSREMDERNSRVKDGT